MYGKDKNEVIKSLRELADKLETFDIDVDDARHWFHTDFTIHNCSKEQLATIARWMGKAKKNASEHYFSLETEVGEIRVLAYAADRKEVCVAKVVGKRTVPAYSAPEREVDVIEWDCTPLLGDVNIVN